MKQLFTQQNMQHPIVGIAVSFLIKIMLLLAVVSFERVIGYPIIASYIFWSFSRRDTLPQQIILILVFSIVLSGLYGLNLISVFLLLAAGQSLLSLGFFRKQKLLRISTAFGCVVIGFWILGMSPTILTLLYGFLQVSLLLVAQLRLGWYRRASW